MKKPKSESPILWVIALLLVLILVLLAFIGGTLISTRNVPESNLAQSGATSPSYSKVISTSTVAIYTRTSSTDISKTNSGLPKAKTATPFPTRVVTVVITNETATSLVAQKVQFKNVQIHSPSVIITQENIFFFGQILVGPAIPGLFNLSGPMRVTMKPQCENEDLRLRVISITVNNIDFEQSEIRGPMEKAINEAFGSLVNSQRVQSCNLADGKLTILAIESR